LQAASRRLAEAFARGGFVGVHTGFLAADLRGVAACGCVTGNTSTRCLLDRCEMSAEFQIGGPVPTGLTRAELMTPDEVAVLLAVPVSTVRDWARRGLIPSRKLGRHRRFLRSEIETWVIRDRAA